jgi:hypothetical protein
MSESELKAKLEKFIRATEELTNRMKILAEGGLDINEDLRHLQGYSPTGIEEPEFIENKTIDLNQELKELKRVYNEMNDSKQLINNELLNTIKELNEINNTSVRRTRSATRSKRSNARGIYKKQKKRLTKKKHIRKNN